jgi:NTE family protein
MARGSVQSGVRAFICACLGVAVVPGAYAAAQDAVVRPRTCLVLGGGGARGAAHVGLLKVLEREHIPVDCIVGTSMGAVVGALYASGYTADRIAQILQETDWSAVLHDSPPRNERSMRRKEDDLRLLGGVQVGIRDGKVALPRGLIQGQRIESMLRQYLLPQWQHGNFDDLSIPFRAIATDLLTGEKVVFASGDLATAVRASMSVPGVFAPVRLDGRLLVDGGVVDNVPIDEARQLGAQRLIVSRVGTPLFTEEQLTSPLAVSEQMTHMLMKRIVEAQLETLGPDDMLLVPDLADITSQDFNRSAQAIRLGQAAAEQALAGLRRFAVDEADYAAFRNRRDLSPWQPPDIEFIEVKRKETRTPDYVAERIGQTIGQPLNVAQLKQDVARIYGEGRYEQVQWHLEERDGLQGVVIEPQDKRWGPGFLNLALRLSDDFDGTSNYQLNLEYTRTGLTSRGAELRLRAGLGEVQQAFAEYYLPFGLGGRQSVSLYANHRATNRDIRLEDGPALATYRYSQLLGGLRWAWSPQSDWEVALFAERGKEGLDLKVGDVDQLGEYHADLGSLGAQLRHDTIDSSAFPSKGQRLSLTYQAFLDALGADSSAGVARLQWDRAWSLGGNRLMGGLRLSSANGSDQLLAGYGFLGGLANLSGFPEQSIFAPQTALARTVFYRRIAHADSLLTIPLYVGGSLEWGGFWGRRRDVDIRDMMVAGSAFVGAQTFLGPIYLGYGRAEGGAASLYLTFGSLLRTLDGF